MLFASDSTVSVWVDTRNGREPCRSTARKLDQFYTTPEVARRCVAVALSLIGDCPEGWVWIEPSAGAGAFLGALPRPRMAFDIAPAGPEIMQADFLEWQLGDISRRVAVIGNPPFGKNASLAIKFFNHAARFADVIAFIVPKTFQKDSVHRKLCRTMHLVHEGEVGTDAFEFGGEPYDVPTVFQVWRRGETLRPLVERLTKHPDFMFVTSREADFAFQRVGARAGLVSDEGLRKSPQSHYFIKAAGRVRSTLTAIDWASIKHRTAGNPSIAKSELVAAYARAVA